MKKEAKIGPVTAFLLLIFTVLFVAFVLAAPNWINEPPASPSTPLVGVEDRVPAISFNISTNVTNTTAGENFTFELSTTGGNPTSIQSNKYGSDEPNSFYFWISLNNSLGILTINSSVDNQSGQYNITIDVKNQDNLGAGARFFYFIINATNDAPNFTVINKTYNLTQDEKFEEYINATDEEEHYPLFFNITFPSCTHATFSTRTNCSLIYFTNISNTSVLMNYTPVRNDVGTYQANITVMDFGENYACAENHCEQNYATNQTTVYSQLINFTVFASLFINVSDCANDVFQENSNNQCQINITSKGATDTLNISTLAIMRNYDGSIENVTWFYTPNITGAVDFHKAIDINFTPTKTEIGNWTINFTVMDITFGINSTVSFNIYVNRTANDAPTFASIANLIVSVNETKVINITIYDDDFLIPDKNVTHGGFNETLTINRTVLNESNPTQELSLSSFEIVTLSMPNGNTNRTEAKIEFTPSDTEIGNYTINLTTFDVDNSTTTIFFNISIFSNGPPVWNATLPEPLVIQEYENNNTYLNFSMNVSDPDGDTLNFSFTNDSSFPGFIAGFNLVTGVLNFTANDTDVGYHNVTITVNDGFLTDTHQFNFTILNINDAPTINKLFGTNITPTPFTDGSNVNASEDFYTLISFWVHDDDLRIPTNQESFYNESLSVSLTIQGPNTNLFNFTEGSDWSTTDPERIEFDAIFTPNKSDVGLYNITINVSDISNRSSTIYFNLSINSTLHNPRLTNLGFINTSVIATLYLDYNATDTEDINDTFPGGNLTYTITNLTTGGNFLNSTNFNRTTGVLNFTFNNSYAGVWRFNISVNDSEGLTDSEEVNFTVYDYPVFLSPALSFQYNLVENVSYELNFSVNHTVQDRLNYTILIDGNIRNSSIGNGTGTQFLWNFTANFSDETTCLGVLNFTLNVSNGKLSNSTTWNITINHTNAPLLFNSNIGDRSGGSPLEITLENHFSDADAADTCINQTIGFISTLLAGASISQAVINWTNTTSPTVTYSSSSAAHANFSIIAYEFNGSSYSDAILSSATSNNFSVTLTISTTPTPSSGGGGGGGGSSTKKPKPISLKVIVPEPITVKEGDEFSVPISFLNDGTVDLKTITISQRVTKGDVDVGSIFTEFKQTIIGALSPNQQEDLTMDIKVNTGEPGLYKIKITGSVNDPSYSDSGDLFLEIKELDDLIERILFTEELIIGNPECVELKELIDEARRLAELGDDSGARDKLDDALFGCQEAIAQPVSARVITRIEENLFGYISIGSLIAFVLGFGYYNYKKFRLRRALLNPQPELQQNL